MPKLNKIRRFSKVEWWMFAGAEKFPDNTDPYIVDIVIDGPQGADIYAIAHVDGEEIGIDPHSNDDSSVTLLFRVGYRTPSEAQQALASLIEIAKQCSSWQELKQKLTTEQSCWRVYEEFK